MRLDGYIRVSRVGNRSGPSFVSPAIQRERIEAWAAYRGVDIARFHTDLDQSGTEIDRPALRRALARVDRGQSDGIAVARFDRLARSITGALEVIKRLDKADGALVSVAEGLDPTTPAGKMLTRLLLVVAEFEVDRLRENWDDSRRLAVARGAYPANKTPAGYRRRDDGRLEPDPRIAPHVTAAIEMRAAFASWREIIGYLEGSVVRDPRGGRTWTSSSIAALIANRAYLGEARSGTFSNLNAHCALVGRGTWEAAQLARELGASRRSPTLLGGILRCTSCRRLMRAGSPRDRRGEPRQLYWCENKAGERTCPQRERIDGGKIERVVLKQFFLLYGGSAMRLRASDGAIDRAELALIAAERAVVDRGEGDSDSPAVALEQARRRLVELTRSRLLPAPQALRARWPQLPLGKRRRYLALVTEAAFVRPDDGRGFADRVRLVPFPSPALDLPVGRAAAHDPYRWEA
jgi:site-specific DNA recombinase